MSTITLPTLDVENGKAACQVIKDALAAAGLPRTSRLAGGELTGVTTAYGSTGFSVRRMTKPGISVMQYVEGGLDWHVVISGKVAGMRYEREAILVGDDAEVTEVPAYGEGERMAPKVAAVFQSLGLTVHEARCTGWQTYWDDDVYFNVVTAPY